MTAWDMILTLIASKTFWAIGFAGCRGVAKSSLFVCLFVCFHQYYSLLGHFSSLTTTASWCFPSKGKNSLKHTSNPPELTFSNHKYIASFGFVLRVYLTETNTRGLEAKLCKKIVTYIKNYRSKNKQTSRKISQHERIDEVLSGT